MAYCTSTDISYFAGTTYDATTIGALIDDADAEINATLYSKDITPPSSSSYLKVASISLTLANLLTRMRIDGRKPANLNIGGISMGDTIDSAISALRERAMKMVDGYIAATAGGSAWESTDGSVDETLVRQDNKMPYYKLDQNPVKEYHDEASGEGTADSDNDTST